jgi:DNA-binding transcriptional ArsR family regulator
MHLNAFEVLADPSRRGIVEALRGGERTVNEIVGALDIHQSGVSRHLRILHESGFVKVRPDGQHRYYSLRPEPFRELDGWLSGYRALWEARLDRFAAALARKQKARTTARTTTRKDDKGEHAREKKP